MGCGLSAGAPPQPLRGASLPSEQPKQLYLAALKAHHFLSPSHSFFGIPPSPSCTLCPLPVPSAYTLFPLPAPSALSLCPVPSPLLVPLWPWQGCPAHSSWCGLSSGSTLRMLGKRSPYPPLAASTHPAQLPAQSSWSRGAGGPRGADLGLGGGAEDIVSSPTPHTDAGTPLTPPCGGSSRAQSSPLSW